MKVDKNPHSKKGDWHKYEVSFVAVAGEKGKEIEIQGHEKGELDIYGLMTLKNAVEIHKTLGEKIEELGGYTIPREVIKSHIKEMLRSKVGPVLYKDMEKKFGKQGISRTSLFVATAELVKREQTIEEVQTKDGIAYKIATYPGHSDEG